MTAIGLISRPGPGPDSSHSLSRKGSPLETDNVVKSAFEFNGQIPGGLKYHDYLLASRMKTQPTKPVMESTYPDKIMY